MVINMTSWTVSCGDYGTIISFTLVISDGVTPWDLDGATVSIIIKSISTQVVTEYPMIIDNASAGMCHYALQATDTATPGTYTVRANINYGSSSYTTVSSGTLIVQKL